MIIEIEEKENKNFYDEIMYISSNYYIFKKNPKTKVHSLTKVFLLYIILLFIFFISFLMIPKMIAVSAISLTLLIVYIYLYVEANYKLREYQKQPNSIIKIDEKGIANTIPEESSTKLYWNAIAYVLFNKHSICILPKNFSQSAIFISMDAKKEVEEALKKYNQLHLIVDNQTKYKRK